MALSRSIRVALVPISGASLLALGPAAFATVAPADTGGGAPVGQPTGNVQDSGSQGAGNLPDGTVGNQIESLGSGGCITYYEDYTPTGHVDSWVEGVCSDFMPNIGVSTVIYKNGKVDGQSASDAPGYYNATTADLTCNTACAGYSYTTNNLYVFTAPSGTSFTAAIPPCVIVDGGAQLYCAASTGPFSYGGG